MAKTHVKSAQILMQRETLIAAWEKALADWTATLTFTGVKNPEGLRRYAVMVEAGEALDANYDLTRNY